MTVVFPVPAAPTPMSTELPEVANRRTIARCPSVSIGEHANASSTSPSGAVQRPAASPLIARSTVFCSIVSSSVVVYRRSWMRPGKISPSRRRMTGEGGRRIGSLDGVLGIGQAKIGRQITDSVDGGMEKKGVSEPHRNAGGTRRRQLLSSRRLPPLGRDSAAALITSARPNVDACSVSPLGEARRSRSGCASGAVTSRPRSSIIDTVSGVIPTSAARFQPLRHQHLDRVVAFGFTSHEGRDLVPGSSVGEPVGVTPFFDLLATLFENAVI